MSGRTSRPSVAVPDVKEAIQQIRGSVVQPFVLPKKPHTDDEAQRLYFHIRTLCFWLDAASSMIQIPLLDQLPFSFGVEAIIGGLLPVAGDLIGFVLGLYVVLLAMQFGLPPSVLWKMLVNCIIDVCVGIIPIIGDLVDLAFKSNLRNLSILEDHLLANPPTKPVSTNGLSSPSAHLAIRIPPSGLFWPKSSAPAVSSFYSESSDKPSYHQPTSFWSNILGSPAGVGSGDTGGWKLGGANKVDIEEVGGWSGESAKILARWSVAIFAKVAGKTQQAGKKAKKAS